MDPKAYVEMANVESQHWWFIGRRAVTNTFLDSMNLPPKASILEVGCGTGGNLPLLTEFGQVSAFEMNPQALIIAQERMASKCQINYGCCPEDVPFLNQRFDLICLFDVLEHIDDELQTLTQLQTILEEDGRLLITVPLHDWLFSNHDKFLHHKRRYSLNRFKDLILQSNLQIERISYFNFFLFPAAIMIRIKERLFNTHSGDRLPNKFTNTILKFIFTSEKYFLKYFDLPIGLSLICSVKKK